MLCCGVAFGLPFNGQYILFVAHAPYLLNLDTTSQVISVAIVTSRLNNDLTVARLGIIIHRKPPLLIPLKMGTIAQRFDLNVLIRTSTTPQMMWDVLIVGIQVDSSRDMYIISCHIYWT
jgi:hypothetical protein